MDFRRFKTITVDPVTRVVNADATKVKVSKPRKAKALDPNDPAVAGVNAAGKLTFYHTSEVPGDYKQWSIWIEEFNQNDPKDTRHNVVTEWGRCGNKLQVNRKTFRSFALAEFTKNKTVRTKKRDGYAMDKKDAQ